MSSSIQLPAVILPFQYVQQSDLSHFKFVKFDRALEDCKFEAREGPKLFLRACENDPKRRWRIKCKCIRVYKKKNKITSLQKETNKLYELYI